MGVSEEKIETHRELPDPKALGEAGDVLIKDKDGKDIPLKSLYMDKPGDERQLLIFVRHFHCGSCQQYVEALMQDLTPEKLSKAKINLTIIGSGEVICIPDYVKATGSTFPIYTDPSVQTYKKLGMISSLRPGTTTPSYLKKSTLDNIVSSTWALFTSGHILSGGPKAQNGGEWLFQGGELRWCHRMRNSSDHTETEELKNILGLD